MSVEISEEALTDPRRLLEDALCSAWSQGFISGGIAAKQLGLSREDFWRLSAGRGYTWPYFLDDLEQDVASLRKVGLL